MDSCFAYKLLTTTTSKEKYLSHTEGKTRSKASGNVAWNHSSAAQNNLSQKSTELQPDICKILIYLQ